MIEKIDESNPVIQQFRQYAQELDDKHDRYERIVKHSRDITIESKRAIFSLHTVDSETKKATILLDVKSKFDKICDRFFREVALEIENRDIYQYLRAYRGGLQEFIEAYTFYWYLEHDCLPHWKEIQKALTFTIVEKENEVENEAAKEAKTRTVQTFIVPNEFVLGIADLTGELMRKCVNSLSTGNLNVCYKTCAFVRDMYREMISCSGKTEKEINKKMITLKRSVMKMENVCYTIKVRGSEIPQHMLAVVMDDHEDYSCVEDDEGYNAYWTVQSCPFFIGVSCPITFVITIQISVLFYFMFNLQTNFVRKIRLFLFDFCFVTIVLSSEKSRFHLLYVLWDH